MTADRTPTSEGPRPSTPEDERGLTDRLSRSMLEKLTANRGKKHWMDCSPNFLLDCLREEVDELSDAIGAYLEEGSADEAEVWAEAADVANFAAMAAENATGPEGGG